MSTADVIAKSAPDGWMPSYPTFNRNRSIWGRRLQPRAAARDSS
jgi:nitrate reductase alpha subunit